MNKLNGIKLFTTGAIAFLSISAMAISNASAQENQKPTPQTEQMSGCNCCKKMMEKKNDGMNKMPGMNHSTSTSVSK